MKTKLNNYLRQLQQYENLSIISADHLTTITISNLLLLNIKPKTSWKDSLLIFLFHANVPKHWLIDMQRLDSNKISIQCINNVAKKRIKQLLITYVHKYVSENR